MKGASSKNKVNLIRNGQQFIDANLELISQAKNFIFLHTYIFEEDQITNKILEELKYAAKRDVHVFIIFDAFGSQDFRDKKIEELNRNKIYFSFFTPFLSFQNYNRRLHQKVLIIDNLHCLLGGINYAKKFNLPENNYPWLDYACIVSGEEVYNTFLKVLPLYKKSFPSHKKLFNSFRAPQVDLTNVSMVKTNLNDWTRNKKQIFKSYLSAISKAETEIYLLATYFIPGKKLLNALKKAKKRNINIHLIFGSKSDHPVTRIIENYFYNWYLSNGIKIYEYDKSIIHGKLAMIDNHWITIGSYNHNFISRYANLEINYEILDKSFGKIIKEEFENIINNSTEIKEGSLQSKKNRILVGAFYFLTNLVTWLSLIFLLRRKKN